MLEVAVEKLDGKKARTASIFDEMKAHEDRIRQRAFEIFKWRGGGDGSAMDDWLKAEHDLLEIPESYFMAKDGKFEIRVNAPGFNAGEVRVMALPNAVIVKAESAQELERLAGKAQFSELDRKTLFRRFDLPEAINLDSVTANLDKGVLHVTALTAKQAAAPKHKAMAA
jgi:HSP20 family molecular chaperone IbpA